MYNWADVKRTQKLAHRVEIVLSDGEIAFEVLLVSRGDINIRRLFRRGSSILTRGRVRSTRRIGCVPR